MAVDLQVVFPQETVAVTGVRNLPGSTPRSIEITGDDFTAIDLVEINEFEVPGYQVVSRTKIIAELPSDVLASQVRSVTVLSRRLVLTARSVLRLRMSQMPSKTSGILRLTQLFLKVLLTTPGSDIFDKELGGGALKNLGSTYSRSRAGSLVNDMSISVQTTQKQITAIQARQANIPADERLADAHLISASFSPRESALLVSISLTNQTGQPALLNLIP